MAMKRWMAWRNYEEGNMTISWERHKGKRQFQEEWDNLASNSTKRSNKARNEHNSLDLGVAAAKSLQLCRTLCDPIDGSPPGSPVPRILQARTLEWIAIAFSNAGKWKVKVKLLSSAQLFSTPRTAAYQAPPCMGFSRQEYWSGVALLTLGFRC